MKTRVVLKIILLIACFADEKAFSQYKSLSESPMFKKDKINLFQDSVGGMLYTLPYMDSLYQAGQAKFQIDNYHKKGDSVFWHIKFITELPSVRQEWIGKTFPLAAFTDINNKRVSYEKLKGKVLIVNCWSVTCGPCVAEIPYLNKLTDSLAGKDVVFLALTYDEADAIKKFLVSPKLKTFLHIENPEFKFQLIGDQKDLLNNTLGIKSYPTTFIVGSDGIVRAVIEGVNLDKLRKPKTYADIMAVVNKLIE